MAKVEKLAPALTRPRWTLPRFSGNLVLAVAMTAAVAAILPVLAGAFNPKVPANRSVGQPSVTRDPPQAEVRLVRKPRLESAVGTVRAVHEAAVASKLLATVVEVKVKAGQAVRRDEVLARLDDAGLQASLKQAEAALTAAEATRGRAASEYERARQLKGSRAISQAEFDQATAAWRSATAEGERAPAGRS
jgi:multidrug efflux pump subunit AcrA (membrane-fusion protein)